MQTRMRIRHFPIAKLGALLGVVLLSACVPKGTLFLDLNTSAPACDGSHVSSSTAAFSVGGTGGCITSVSKALEDSAATIRDGSKFDFQTVDNSYGSSAVTSNSLIAGRFEYAHALNLFGSGEVISIYDTGYNSDHVELRDQNLLYREGTPVEDLSYDTHGSAVAALAAGSQTWGSTVGAAPGASLYLMTWDAFTLDESIDEAIASESIVLNNSWGYNCPGDPFSECGINDYGIWLIPNSYRTALLDYAGDEGIVVFSTSNEEHQTQATFMAALPVHIPALEEGWLAVINIARDYDVTEADLFDDTNIELLSSGCLEAAKWCVAADGTSVVAANGTTGYSIGTGTSFAAPRVSAAIAILAEAFPNLSASEIRNRLIITADNDFFSGDTANIQTLNFDGGLSHDYHWVYGHGFIDLKAALLPIGGAMTTTSKGEVINLNEPVILAGSASGDAIRTELSKVTLYAQDQMGGEFEVPAEAMVATSIGGSNGYRQLLRMSNFEKSQSLLDLNSPLQNTDSIVVPFEIDSSKLEMHFPITENDEIGVRLSTELSTRTGTFQFGLSGLRDQSSLLGLSLGNVGNISSDHLGIDARFARELGVNSELTLVGQVGKAGSTSTGFFDEIGLVTYSSLGAQFTQEKVFTGNDQISLYASQPTSIRSGHAAATLQTAQNGSKSPYRINIPLAPTKRETEIGLEYITTGIYGEDWNIQISQRFNAENQAENDIKNVTFGVRMQF